MVNPYRGEVALEARGQRHVMRLNLSALVALETDLGTGSLVELVARFEEGRFSARDIVALLAAGLGRPAAEVAGWDIEGGPVAAARAAAQLLAVTFSLPEPQDTPK